MRPLNQRPDNICYAVRRRAGRKETEVLPCSIHQINVLDRIIVAGPRNLGSSGDRNSREIEAIYGAEGTARVGLALERLLAGLDTLGVERTTALKVVKSVAMDSVPPIRRRAYDYLQSVSPTLAETKAVANALGLPSNTVRRALEDLAAYDLAQRTSQGAGRQRISTTGGTDMDDNLQGHGCA
jgi:hypothetical protein